MKVTCFVLWFPWLFVMAGLSDLPGGDTPAKVYRQNSKIQTSHAGQFLEKIHFRGDESILDIGCGDGRITADLHKAVPMGFVKGIDVSEEMIMLARETFPEITFEIADAVNYLDDTLYDVITCLSTLHWFLDQEGILKKLKSLLKPNGKILILAYSPIASYWKPMEEGTGSSQAFYCQLEKSDLLPLIHKAGFSFISFDIIDDIAIFRGEEGYLKHVEGFLPHLRNLLPSERREILSSIGSSFLKWNPPDEDGNICLPYETYELTLQANH